VYALADQHPTATIINADVNPERAKAIQYHYWTMYLKANATVQNIKWEPNLKGRKCSMIFDKIWRLQRKLSAIDIDTYNEVQKMRKNACSSEEIGSYAVRIYTKRLALEERLQFLRGRRLIIEAERLGLPIPSHDDKANWMSGFTNRPATYTYLSIAAQAQLRRAIRQEKKERREIWTTVVKDIITPIGGIVISILSLMIAYAALKLKH
jgi:hypothetical protein